MRNPLTRNLAKAMKDGPALRSYSTWVEARDPSRGRILIGGLGGWGAGAMWGMEREESKARLGYREAPVVDSESPEWADRCIAEGPSPNATVWEDAEA